MSRVKIYSTASCPICDKAKNLLSKWNIPYDEYRIDENSDALKEMFTITNGARTVPQITIDGKWVGGFSELTELHMDGELDDLIAQ